MLGGLETIHAIKRRNKEEKALLIKVHILLLVKHIKTNKHTPSQPLGAPCRRILNDMLIRRAHKLLGSCYCVYRVNNGCYWLMYIITLDGGAFSCRMLRRTRRTSSSLSYANFHHGKLHCMCATRARVANWWWWARVGVESERILMVSVGVFNDVAYLCGDGFVHASQSMFNKLLKNSFVFLFSPFRGRSYKTTGKTKSARNV